MAIQDFQVIYDGDDERRVVVFDMPPVEERRNWFLRWLGICRHKQLACWRNEDGDTAYVSPEFLTEVCGRKGVKYLQRDAIWFGIPRLKGKAHTKSNGSGDGKVTMTPEQRRRLEEKRAKKSRFPG